MSAPNLELINTAKIYDGLQVLHDVSFAVSPGEVVALVGHNGAGKTTIMKLLLGLIRPTSGSVQVLGHDPAGSNAAQARLGMGFLPETVSFPANMTGQEIMNFYARLKRQDRQDNERLLDMVGLGDAASRRVKTYSKGMRQRLGLAQALIGSPRVLLLDEPFSALDMDTRDDMLALVRRIVTERNLTCLMVTHDVRDCDRVADRRYQMVVDNGNRRVEEVQT